MASLPLSLLLGTRLQYDTAGAPQPWPACHKPQLCDLTSHATSFVLPPLSFLAGLPFSPSPPSELPEVPLSLVYQLARVQGPSDHLPAPLEALGGDIWDPTPSQASRVPALCPGHALCSSPAKPALRPLPFTPQPPQLLSYSSALLLTSVLPSHSRLTLPCPHSREWTLLHPPSSGAPGLRGSGNIGRTPAPALLALWSEAEKRSYVWLHSPGAADQGPWTESGLKLCFLWSAQSFQNPNLLASGLHPHTPGLWPSSYQLHPSSCSPTSLPPHPYNKADLSRMPITLGFSHTHMKNTKYLIKFSLKSQKKESRILWLRTSYKRGLAPRPLLPPSLPPIHLLLPPTGNCTRPCPLPTMPGHPPLISHPQRLSRPGPPWRPQAPAWSPRPPPVPSCVFLTQSLFFVSLAPALLGKDVEAGPRAWPLGEGQ